jgi:hypothetical protein
MHVGRLTLTVTSDNADAVVETAAKTISFPAVDIRSSSTPLVDGTPRVSYSHFRIASTGSIPARISVTATVRTSTGVEAQKFTLVRDGGTDGPVVVGSLPVTDLVIAGPQSADIDEAIGFLWGELTNESMGGSVMLTLTIDAAE